MLRFPRLGRLAAAAVLVLGGSAIATVASTAPASAANINVSAVCTGTPPAQTVNNSDTVTFTFTAGCTAVMLQTSAGGTATAAGFTLTQGTPRGGYAAGDTVVLTAPSSGTGTAQIVFLATAQTPPGTPYNITFPAPTPRNDTLTDNGNGSMTVTYAAVTSPASVFVSFFPAGTTCDPTGSQASWATRLYVVSSSSNTAPLGSSPSVLTAGSSALVGSPPNMSVSTIAAGSYQACLYYSSGQSTTLEQSLAITLGAVAPTTTLAPTTTTTVAGDPVVPAFTG